MIWQTLSFVNDYKTSDSSTVQLMKRTTGFFLSLETQDVPTNKHTHTHLLSSILNCLPLCKAGNCQGCICICLILPKVNIKNFKMGWMGKCPIK